MAEFPAIAAAVDAFTRRGPAPPGPGPGRPLDRVCAAMVADLDIDGASISVGTTRPEQRETAGTSDETASLLEELQYDLGVGPCFDAVSGGRPVLVGDLASPTDTRWPTLTPGLVRHGVRAVWAVPLLVGTGTVGVAEIYRRRAGLPTTGGLGALTRALAVALPAVLALPPPTGPAPHGRRRVRTPGPEPPGADDEDLQLMPPGSRVRVHQATGMVVAQLGVTPSEALARLRAHAWAQGRSLSEVCTDVIDRTLRLSPR